MITFKELLKIAKTEKVAVHTSTEEQAVVLLSKLNKRGYVWKGKYDLITTTHFGRHEEDTCYALEPNNRICYSSITWYQIVNYKIIEFSEIDFKGEK